MKRLRRWAVVTRQGYANQPGRKGPVIAREHAVTRWGAERRQRASWYRPGPLTRIANLGPMWHTEVMRAADADLLEARVGNAS